MISCTHISDYAKWRLEKPISCDTAVTDIHILEGERANTFKKLNAGVRSVMPSGIVVGILKEDYSDGVRVASGSYNRAIETKIQDIKDYCNL